MIISIIILSILGVVCGGFALAIYLGAWASDIDSERWSGQ